jgi:hypothetical protein
VLQGKTPEIGHCTEPSPGAGDITVLITRSYLRSDHLKGHSPARQDLSPRHGQSRRPGFRQDLRLWRASNPPGKPGPRSPGWIRPPLAHRRPAKHASSYGHDQDGVRSRHAARPGQECLGRADQSGGGLAPHDDLHKRRQRQRGSSSSCEPPILTQCHRMATSKSSIPPDFTRIDNCTQRATHGMARSALFGALRFRRVDRSMTRGGRILSFGMRSSRLCGLRHGLGGRGCGF